MKIYMHLLNESPAYFDGYQVVYGSGEIRKFCDSLKEIRNEQILSQKNRVKDGFDIFPYTYGYTRIYLDVEDKEGEQ